MKMNRFGLFVFLIAALSCVIVNSQSISDSLNSFGINLLGQTTSQAGDSLNVALSTYSVWSLMTLVSEGARGNTLEQLRNTLRLPEDRNLLRQYYQNLTRFLGTKKDSVTLDLNTAVFSNSDFPVKDSFESVAKNIYDVSVTPVNFGNTNQAVNTINKYVARATRNRIPTFVNSGDVSYAQVFLTSILYFKGRWKMPFNVSETHVESFYDEKNNKIGEVDMMFQIGVFPYQRFEEYMFHAFELPYGHDDKMSMIVILPFKSESLLNVLSRLSKIQFSTIIAELERAGKLYKDDEVYVYLPKFKYASDFNLNSVLIQMGIKDVFDINKADLLDMFDQYLFLSRMIQRAEIEVNEEGTVATAAAGAAFPDRQTPPIFRANRPFLYFIVDKPTRSVLFAGKITNPNTLK